MFKEKDINQIEVHGADPEVVKQQIENFKSGFPFLRLEAAAIVGDGIMQLSEEDKSRFIEYYDTNRKNLSITKMIPASGAASRMFKDLFSFLDELRKGKIDPEISFKQEEYKNAAQFFDNLPKFAFYPDLQNSLNKDGVSVTKFQGVDYYIKVLEHLLEPKGLNYGNLPKGLLKFHQYEEFNRTPVEEHLAEGALYARDGQRNANIHFTVSPEHKQKFIQHIFAVKEKYQQALHVEYFITFSEQKAATDTIAVDLSNEPFREEDGSLLFRPAGHGALLSNLNDLDTDIIFIKNIDNVVPDRLKKDTIDYKKALAGILLEYQTRLFAFIKRLKREPDNQDLHDEIQGFLSSVFSLRNIPELSDAKERYEFLIHKLNRPIRVCGMVKNEGEAGGGPFFAQNPDGTVSLQVVEQSQIDMEDDNQREIALKASHFNPVDLVCGIKDYYGNKFDLRKFTDPSTGFISKKSKDGRELKAQELPGLWNGAMSDWNSIFVEVPISTFNPVKTINDLLREQHQV